MRDLRSNYGIKSLLFLFLLLSSTVIFAQDILMQNGSIQACAPARFLDSGGASGNYSSNENFTITLCPDTPGDILILDFTAFSTQLGSDILTIYDGASTASPVIGNFSGTVSPRRVVSTDASGCLTVSFSTNGFGNTIGWIADIECAQPCQIITPSIDSTTPAVNPATNTIEILPGQNIDFSGSAVFSDSDAGATYLWNFGDLATADTLDASFVFNAAGNYTIEFTATDTNPLGCSETVSINVVVLPSIVTINNPLFAESFFTPAQLMANVLVKSGDCSTVDEFSSEVFGDADQLTTKSYGYFTRGSLSDADFPFASGIVLTTGTAALGGNIPSTTIINELTGNGRPGDSDLEDKLGPNSLDATFFKFNFTSTTDNISFKYLMASEEYIGTFQCDFSDGFAFLLRIADSGDPYTNLAVLSDGSPVDVTNVNGVFCPGDAGSGIEPDFEGYNLGATNYNGRTDVMIASAQVIPNTTYEIKLVVADYGNNGGLDDVYDTAIFIETGSFNLGGDLGDDLTLAAGTAECGGQQVTLNTNVPGVPHTWFFNGVEIPGATSSTLDIQEAGFYEVLVTFGANCDNRDEIIVEFRNSPEIVAPPENLATCSPTGTASFNLDQNTPLVFGGQSATEFSINYHNSQADADTGNNPIADPTNYNGTDGELIFVSIADSATGRCVVTAFFTLNVFSSVTSEDVTFQVCDNNLDGDATNGFVEFDLLLINDQVLGTQSPTQFSVSYHLLPTEAENNANPLPNLYTNTTVNSQIIYVRVENNSNIDCFETSEVTLQVDRVAIANPVEDQFICDDNNDGLWSFDLAALIPAVLGTQQSVADFEVTFHNLQTEADMDMGALTSPYTNQTAYQQETVFVRIENTNNANCFATTSFEINVFNQPTATAFTYQLCDNADDSDDTNGIVAFDLPTINTDILGAQDPALFTVSYHFDQADADAGAGPLANLYTNATANSQIVYARVENNNNTACFETVEVTLQVDRVAVANTVADQLICDDNNDGFWDFDLAALIPTVLGTQQLVADFEVTFHNLQTEADMDMGALTSPYTNQTAYQQETIFVRIENRNNADCFATTSFEINVFNQPTATAFTYELCDNADDGNDTNGFVAFDLPAINTDILGTQDPAEFSVSYYFDQANANTATNPLANLYTNTITNTQQIVARVENIGNAACFTTALVNLQVNTLPVITDAVQLLQCDDDNDGLSTFNLTEANTLISADPSLTFTYYENATDAVNSVGAITNSIDYPNTDASSNPDILFVRVENANSCFRVAQLDLIVSTTQIPAGFEVLYEECDTAAIDNDITNGITTFDFSSAEAQIRTAAAFPAGQNLTFTYYQSEADALAETNEITDITNYRNDASPFEQEIYVRVDSDVDNSCLGLGVHIRLRTTNPNPNTAIQDLVRCDDLTIGDLQEPFDLTQNETDIFNGATNLVASYFTSFADALTGSAAITTPTAYTNTNPTETIFVRVEGNTSGCFAIVDFDILVNPLPTTFPIEPLEACENATDGFFEFDLDSKTGEILDGQDPALFTVTFHESQSDADDLLGPLPNLYTNTSNPQQIFVAITNTVTGCSNSSESFIIEVIEGAQANSDGDPLDFELCDDNILNDGVAQFDLTSIEPEILDGQDAADVTITYHFSMADALNGVNLLPTLYENLTNPQIIYTRVSNNLSPDVCFEVQPIPLRVNPLPIFNLEDIYVLCTSSNGSEVVPIPPVLDTGLSETDFSFEWSLDGVVLATETASSLIPTQGGIYDVVVTDITTSTITRCTSMDSAEVIESEPPVITAEVTSQAFAGNHTVEATVEGASTYEYNLDNGPWQNNGSFENVPPGIRTISARDVNGCGVSSVSILVIDYPLFFTPNGDGNNDTWNIEGIDTQPNAKIYIFDRYGKLLKQLSPTSPGWDGTYRGNRLPTDDYWFSIEYTEPLTGETKQKRAHFTLKR